MADNVDPETRSRIMRSITGEGTYPERWTASALYGMGAEFEPHADDLPGTPDFVLRDRGVAIFVHGCFWHRHDCPDGRQVPDTNVEFWKSKFDRNVERDREAVAALEADGWEVVTVWECEIHDDPDATSDRIAEEVFGGDRPVERMAAAIVGEG